MRCLLSSLKTALLGFLCLAAGGAVFFGYLTLCEKIGGQWGFSVGMCLLLFGVIFAGCYIECKSQCSGDTSNE